MRTELYFLFLVLVHSSIPSYEYPHGHAGLSLSLSYFLVSSSRNTPLRRANNKIRLGFGLEEVFSLLDNELLYTLLQIIAGWK